MCQCHIISYKERKVSKLEICSVHRKRGKKGEKNGKGLRHFSMKVCEKVQKKGVTTYNEVADELVAEFSSSDNHMSPNDSVSAAAATEISVKMAFCNYILTI